MDKVSSAGLYSDIPEQAYHDDPAPEPSLSRSVIQQLLYRSPAHAWTRHPRLNPGFRRDEESRFDLGSAAHDALLCGMGRVEAVAYPDWRRREAQVARKAIRQIGKLPVLAHQYDAIAEMVRVAREFWVESELAEDLFEQGQTELTVLWQEAAHTWCRARWDWVSRDRALIVDYKSTLGSGNPEDWGRAHLVHDGLDIQAAWYMRANVATATQPLDRPVFVFLVQECAPPFACSLVALQKEFLAMGEEKCARGLYVWEQCRAHNHWPSYPSRVHWIAPPAFAFTQWEELQIGEPA